MESNNERVAPFFFGCAQVEKFVRSVKEQCRNHPKPLLLFNLRADICAENLCGWAQKANFVKIPRFLLEFP
jgi:hypothetical protein